MPRIIPEPRYFSIPSIELGAEVLRNRALNCWPWARSLIHSPDAVIHSPAEMMAAWPTTVSRSRCPRAFVRDQSLRSEGVFLQKFAHQFQRSMPVSLRLDEDIEDLAFGVDCAPEIDHPATDFQ